MMTRARRLAAIALGLLLAAAFAQAPIPPLDAHVTDTTGTLAAADRERIEARLAAFEVQRGAQVAVLVVASTAPETIDAYGIRVAERWRLGRRHVDDGAILLVALQERAVRIEVGYGLEGVLTDAVSHRILAEDVQPRFQAGDLAGGITAGTDRMMAAIAGEPLPAPAREASSDVPWLPVVLALAVIGAALRRWLGPPAAGVLTGSATGVLAWSVSGSAPLGVVIGLAAGIAAFAGVLRWLPFAGPRSASGGWRGGGGGFGGGGASGRW